MMMNHQTAGPCEKVVVNEMTPTSIFLGLSPQIGQIGIQCTGPYMHIFAYDAPEEHRMAQINWSQIRKLVVHRIGWTAAKYVIHFNNGRLPETMVSLMVNDNRLEAVLKNGRVLLQELMDRGLLSKRNTFINVHYVPTCPMMPAVQPRPPPSPVALLPNPHNYPTPQNSPLPSPVRSMSFPPLSCSPLPQVLPVAAPWNRVTYAGVTQQHMSPVHPPDLLHAHHQAQAQAAAQHQQHLQQQQQWSRDQMARWVVNNPQLVLREESHFMGQGKMM